MLDRLTGEVLRHTLLSSLNLLISRSARKAARSILKQRPESLRLYAAFALIELQINGSDASDRVFATAIKLSGTLPSDKAFDVIGLWRCWVWQALREAKLDEALRRLAAIGFHTPEGLERTLQTDVSKIDLLRAKDVRLSLSTLYARKCRDVRLTHFSYFNRVSKLPSRVIGPPMLLHMCNF